MKKVLLIKLTSLGDLIHALPALSDAHAARPDITFDWVIDENFAEVATWHPAVGRTFMTNHRKWRKKIFHPSTLKLLWGFTQEIHQTPYDLILDGQGNFKSALLSLFTQGPRAGFDRHSVREWVAHLSYQRRYGVSKQSHAIERLRRLFALALEYPFPLSAPDYQIQKDKFVAPSLQLPEDYLFFVHNASWKTKLWPEAHWIDLIKRCTAEGFSILLPHGNQQEKERAERLCVDARVHVLPRLRLSEIGYLLCRARACVAMDTGLAHLIAALNVPSVTLYGSTNAGLIGSTGQGQIHLASTRHCAPCEKKSCRYSEGDSPCLQEITPDRVHKELLSQASLRYL